MNYLSGKGFIHRDLAARNVLVSHKETCKVCHYVMYIIIQGRVYTHYDVRLQTLVCRVLCKMPSTMSLVEGKSL